MQPMVINVLGGSASAAASASAQPTMIVMRKPFNHGLHGLLTLVTCGMWLPVWIVLAIFHKE